MSDTGWFYDGCPVVLEFREYGEEGSETLQAREVYKFQRHKEVVLTGNLTVSKGDLGSNSTGAGLSALQGARTINAITIIGGNRRWVCTKDGILPGPEAMNVYRREQEWEMREAWADYTWPNS